MCRPEIKKKKEKTTVADITGEQLCKAQQCKQLDLTDAIDCVMELFDGRD